MDDVCPSEIQKTCNPQAPRDTQAMAQICVTRLQNHCNVQRADRAPEEASRLDVQDGKSPLPQSFC